MQGGRLTSVLLYGMPGVLVGLALAFWMGGQAQQAVAQTGAQAKPGRPAEAPRSQAQTRKSIAGGEVAGTLAMITNGPGNSQFLYLVDSKRQAFAIYRVDPSAPNGAVKLEASRQYKWDLELEHYNNQAPEPAAIEATVKTLAGSSR